MFELFAQILNRGCKKSDSGGFLYPKQESHNRKHWQTAYTLTETDGTLSPHRSRQSSSLFLPLLQKLWSSQGTLPTIKYTNKQKILKRLNARHSPTTAQAQSQIRRIFKCQSILVPVVFFLVYGLIQYIERFLSPHVFICHYVKHAILNVLFSMLSDYIVCFKCHDDDLPYRLFCMVHKDIQSPYDTWGGPHVDHVDFLLHPFLAEYTVTNLSATMR